MWQDILRLAIGWGAMLAVIAFWYWVFSSIGTF
jgi:hypothetical protein